MPPCQGVNAKMDNKTLRKVIRKLQNVKRAAYKVSRGLGSRPSLLLLFSGPRFC